MAAQINAFEVFARIGLDDSGLRRGLSGAKGLLSGFGSAAGGAFSGLVGLASRAFSSIGRLAKDFINDSYKTAQEFEQSMAQVAATLGKTVEEVNADIQTTIIDGEEWTGNLREFAMEMSARTKFTAVEVGEALNFMALAGYDTAKSMEMLPPVLSLAAAGAMELGRASDVVTDAQTAFGISSERTVQMVDEMAKAASTGNTSVAQLGEAFLTVGGLAKEIGSSMMVASDGTKVEVDSLQELETALVAMANAGVKGSEAGTHMRNMLLKLSAPTEEGKNKLQEIGVSALDAAGNMRSLHDIFYDMSHALSTMSGGEKMEALADIFNARDITAAQSLLSAASNGSWDKIASSILDAEGAAERMAETQLNTVMGQKQLMESALDIFKIELSSNINLPFAGWIKQGTNIITALTDALKKDGLNGMFETLFEEGAKIVDNLFKTAIPKMINQIPKIIVRGVPTLINGLLTIGTSIVNAFTGQRFMQNIRAAASNTLFLIRTSFTERREEMQETGAKLFDLLVDGLKAGAEFIGENLLPVITKIASFFMNGENLVSIIDAGADILDTLVGGITSEDSLDALFDEERGLPAVIGAIIDGIGELATRLVKAAKTIISNIVHYFMDRDNKREIRQGAIDILDHLGKAFVNVVGTIHSSIVDLMSDIMVDMVGSFDADATAIDMLEKLGKSLLKESYRIPYYMGTGIFGQLYIGNEQDRSIDNSYLNAAETYGEDFPGTREQWLGEEGERWRAEHSARRRLSYTYEATNESIYANHAGGQAAYDAYMRSMRGYATGGIFDRPTYALIGEDGAEAVMPLEKNTGWIDRLADRLNGNGITIQFGNIYVTGAKDAGREVVAQIDTALRQYQIMQQRGVGGSGWA